MTDCEHVFNYEETTVCIICRRPPWAIADDDLKERIKTLETGLKNVCQSNSEGLRSLNTELGNLQGSIDAQANMIMAANVRIKRIELQLNHYLPATK